MDNNRYIQLERLVFDTFLLDCPAEIEKGALLLDSRTKTILLQLRLNILNYDVKDISSITLNIECMDDAGELIKEIHPKTHTFRDVHLLDSKTLGEKSPIILDHRTRIVNVSLEKVVFTDGKVWLYSGGEIKPPSQEEITTLDVPLKMQLERDVNSLADQKKKRIVYFPQQQEDYWLCTCGRPNANDNNNCSRCVLLKSWVFETINKLNIQKHYEEHLAEIQKKEKEESIRRKVERVRREKNRKIIRNIALALIPMITTFLLFIYVLVPFIKYTQATKMLSNKEYDRAITVLTSLENYKDSTDLISESYYQKAGELLSEKQYDDASAIYNNLLEYKDSSELVKETSYQKANALLLNDRFDEAITIFTELEGYEDSKELVNVANYQKASAHLSKKEYKEAMDIFNKIQNFKDSKILSKEATYQLANVYLLDKKFDEANNLFDSIPDYKNARELSNEAVYLQVKEMLSRKNLEEALTLLTKIYSYKDSKEIINRTRYEWGNQLVLKRQFEQAINLLEKVNSTIYPDVTEKLKSAKFEFAKQKALSGDYKGAYYLIEKIDYKDSKTLAKEYEKKAFAWRFEGKLDNGYYSRYDNFTFHGNVYGGRLGEEITLAITCQTPDWTNTSYYRNLTNGRAISYSIRNSNPAYARIGDGKFIIRNSSTWEILAEYSFYIVFEPAGYIYH